MNTQITDMCVRAEIKKSRQVRHNYQILSNEQLGEIVGRYVPNPVARTFRKLFVDNRTPSTRQYEIAKDILEERTQ